jgi:hypothetical protein
VQQNQNRGKCTILLLLAVFGVSHAVALTIDDLDVTSKGRAFTVQMTLEIAASVDQVIAVLTDYRHPNRMNPEVTKREVISRMGEITRVHTVFRGCAVFFCRDVELTQDVTVIAGIIHSEIVPEMSDFRSGSMRWLVSRSANGGSYINYAAMMEPDFFIPPLIGKLIIRKRLRREMLETAKSLEEEAARHPAPAMNRD